MRTNNPCRLQAGRSAPIVSKLRTGSRTKPTRLLAKKLLTQPPAWPTDPAPSVISKPKFLSQRSELQKPRQLNQPRFRPFHSPIPPTITLCRSTSGLSSDYCDNYCRFEYIADRGYRELPPSAASRISSMFPPGLYDSIHISWSGCSSVSPYAGLSEGQAKKRYQFLSSRVRRCLCYTTSVAGRRGIALFPKMRISSSPTRDHMVFPVGTCHTMAFPCHVVFGVDGGRGVVAPAQRAATQPLDQANSAPYRVHTESHTDLHKLVPLLRDCFHSPDLHAIVFLALTLEDSLDLYHITVCRPPDFEGDECCLLETSIKIHSPPLAVPVPPWSSRHTTANLDHTTEISRPKNIIRQRKSTSTTQGWETVSDSRLWRPFLEDRQSHHTTIDCHSGPVSARLQRGKPSGKSIPAEIPNDRLCRKPHPRGSLPEIEIIQGCHQGKVSNSHSCYRFLFTPQSFIHTATGVLPIAISDPSLAFSPCRSIRQVMGIPKTLPPIFSSFHCTLTGHSPWFTISAIAAAGAAAVVLGSRCKAERNHTGKHITIATENLLKPYQLSS